MHEPEISSKPSTQRRGTALWNVIALGAAAIAAAGSVYLSVGLGLKACPLCFYQRAFAVAALLVMAMQLWLDGLRSLRACLLVLPLALSGLGVAIFHVSLTQTGRLECPPALFGWRDGPAQSLAIFAALAIVCAAGAWSAHRAESPGGLAVVLAAIVLGAGATWACIASAPPLAPPPAQAYDPVKQPFDMCRPPYTGP